MLRRAPTLTDEQRQQRVGSRALSPLRALAAELEGETAGKLGIRPSKVHPAVPGKAHLQGLISNPHGQTMGKPAKRCIRLHVAPIRMSPWMTDDDPLTKFDNAAALSRK